ncbi:Armadillo-like helical domain-containing protein 3 [Chionoecetes opilio]|uniref:Armadillo-like helical domain-containing protein 3 n=1 Tax=Chionoecetes opilio TaxID=41210 RepID=A0A8J5D000_CHIOP|nr:Armadillo-like helical domain-containing protein 3 [Chionoecetes opilio]
MWIEGAEYSAESKAIEVVWACEEEISDVMVEFMMSHMMKKLPIELFLLNVGITHRLLCYQKRNSVRLPYNWKDLWAALIALAKFLVTNEAYLAKKMNIFQLANQVSVCVLMCCCGIR